MSDVLADLEFASRQRDYTSLGLEAGRHQPVTRQHNDLLQARYTMTLMEKQIIGLAMSKIFAKGGLFMGDAPTFVLRVEDFKHLYQNESTSLYSDLKKAVKKLGSRQVNVMKRVGDKTKAYGWFNWLSSCSYHDKEGALSVRFTTEANDYLYMELKGQDGGNFTVVELMKIASFKSYHSVRLYELLCQFRKTGWKSVEVQELKEMLQLEKNYKVFKDFNKWVLRPAIAEINKHHNLRLTMSVDKKGRTPHMLTFRFKTF